ncbi:hypothetical protein [Pseudomonas sp. FP2335]|jgi:hypothetical protein|uniref:hypothetical protein n=1 Tax=Pseudomonas sp. FP2335 TaxID=2954092 RepID=UPI00351DB1CC
MGVSLLPVYAAIEGLRNGTLVRVMPEILAAHQAELAAYELSGGLGGARLVN